MARDHAAELLAILARERQTGAERKAAEAEKSPVARYLTVGTATVDITHETENPDTTIARCLGCNERHRYEWNPEQWDYNTKAYRRLGSNPERADKQARDWAQGHASVCRAMPMPEGSTR